MIHDKSNTPGWTEHVDDWEAEFENRDIVIGPGYASFREMYMVHEITPNSPGDSVTHKGVFWELEEAQRYAKDRHERMHKEAIENND